MMKKTITLILFLFCAGITSGQLPVDYIIHAKALRESGKTDMAISLLDSIIAKTQESRLYLERAESYVLNRNYSGAISDFNEANKLSHFSGEYGLSRIYALKGDANTALYHLERNLNSSFKKGEKEIMLEPAFGIIENKSEWRQFWKKEWFSFTERSISQIEYLNSTGRIDESRDILLELKERYQSNRDIQYAEALIDLSAGKYTDVLKVLSGLIAVNPENEKYLRILALAQTGASNMAGASNTYSKLLDLGIADAKLLVLRTDCYRMTGENSKALSDIEKYLHYYPDSKEALSLAGKIVAASGDNLRAIEYFSKNLKLHPGDPECYIDRANSYFVSKSWDWAIMDYSMSLDLKPEDSQVWLNKGIALLKSGRVEDACHDFRKSFRLGNKSASKYISKNCIK